MLTLKEAVTIPKQKKFGDYENFVDYKLSKEAEAEIKKNEAKNAKLPKLQQKFSEIRNEHTSKLLEKYFGTWQKNENKFILRESSDEYNKRWTNELWQLYQNKLNKVNAKFDNIKLPTKKKWNKKTTHRVHSYLIRIHLKKFFSIIKKWEKQVIENEGIIFRETYRKDKIIAAKRKKAKEAAAKLKAAKKKKLYKRTKLKLKRKETIRKDKKSFKEETRDTLSLIQSYSLYLILSILCFCGCFSGFIYLRDVEKMFESTPK